MKGASKYIPFFLFLLSAVIHAGENKKIDSLLNVLGNSAGDTNTVIILNKIGEEFSAVSPDSAIRYCDNARKLAGKIGYKRGLANSLMMLAVFNSAHNRYQVALEYNLKALPLMEELGNTTAQTRIYRNIGTIYYGIHDYENALKNYEEGLNIAQEFKIKNEIPGLLSNIGIIWHSKLDYGKAMDFYIQALKAAEANNNKRSRSYVLNSIGKLYFDIGKKDEQMRDFDQAINYYMQSYELKKDLDDKKGMANTLGNIGEVQRERGRFNESISYYEKGYDLAKQTDYKEWLETGCLNMANLYSTMGDYKKAFEFFKEYASVKDTLESINERKAMAELQDKFDDEKRDKEIALLNKENELKESKLNRQRMTIWFASAGLVIVIAFAFYIFRSFREKQKINRIIEEKNKNITDSIMYARRIQTAILPSQEMMSKSFRDFFIFYKPKDIVSGDFYFFTEMNGKIIIAAADCTGHGVPGAFMSMIGNSLLNQIIKEKNITTPAEILYYLHLGVSNSLNQNKDALINNDSPSEINMKDGMDIALCCIDRPAKKIEYAGANRNLYLFTGNDLKEINADKSAIGGVRSESEVKFTNHIVDYSQGDTIYLSTDGYADQFGGPEGKKFRTKRFRELLGSMKDKAIAVQREELEKIIVDWMGNNEQLDDILVIGARL